MTDRYLKSTTGSDANTGQTNYANAKATLASVAAAMAAGDTTYSSQVHAENLAGTITFPGTIGNPNRLICGNDAASPPTADASTAALSTIGAQSLSIQGSALIRGVVLTCGNGANAANISLCSLSSAIQRYENCDIIHADTHTSAVMIFGLSLADASSRLTFKDSRFKQPATNGNAISMRGVVRIDGGSFITGTLTPTAGIWAIGTQSRDTDFLAENIELANVASDAKLFRVVASNAYALIRNSSLPAAWTGTLIANAITAVGWVAEMRNCNSGSTLYRYWHESYPGQVRDVSTVVRTGGASDAVGGYTLRMVTNASASEINPLRLLEITFDVTAVGSPITRKVHVIHDSATALTDAQLWGEVHSLNDIGSAKGTRTSTQRASPLAAPTNVPASAATFTGSVVSGMSNPNKQELSVTFTPQVAGRYIYKVMLGAASKTLYACPAVA
jgi:hypothetical protein